MVPPDSYKWMVQYWKVMIHSFIHFSVFYKTNHIDFENESLKRDLLSDEYKQGTSKYK